jgi:hypothetical protein
MADPADARRLINLRLYRLAFAPALVALVVVMFSLDGVPPPIAEPVAAGTYQGDAAAAAAREIARTAPDRPAGSPGDSAIAEFVIDRFQEITGGTVSEQEFEADVDGDEVSVRNVLLTLPGETDRTVVVVAGRDSERGPGAASSAAATGALVELASSLGIGGHEATYVLVSTSGGDAGAAAAVDAIDDRSPVEAVVALSQPGPADPSQPYLVTSSSGETSASIQLRRTAAEAISDQVGTAPTHPSAFESLARLAIPSGLGPQAPLIADGVDAVTISGAGERPSTPSADGPEDLSEQSLDAFGRAAQILVGEIDLSPELEHGPSAYVEIGDNLIPGWSLSLLALCLLIPALAAAIDGCARASRRGLGLAGGLGWAASRSMPAVGALALLYGLALVGVVPRPEFPFDPGLEPLGARAAVALTLIGAAAIASAVALRALGVTGPAAPLSAVPALGAITVAAALLLWLANPYLALLAVPIAHVWLLADRPASGARGARVTAAAALACVPVAAAVIAVSRALALGPDAPWTLTIMVADGQLGLGVMVPACFLAGAVLATIALATARDRALPTEPGGDTPGGAQGSPPNPQTSVE